RRARGRGSFPARRSDRDRRRRDGGVPGRVLVREPSRAAARQTEQHGAVTPPRRAACRDGGAVRGRRGEGADRRLGYFFGAAHFPFTAVHLMSTSVSPPHTVCGSVSLPVSRTFLPIGAGGLAPEMLYRVSFGA